MSSLIVWSGTAAMGILFLTSARVSTEMECTVCHSKNPAIVKMHKATKAKNINCFDCHQIGEKLMGKGQPKDRASLLRRRVTDGVCKGCHQ